MRKLFQYRKTIHVDSFYACVEQLKNQEAPSLPQNMDYWLTKDNEI